MPVPVPRLLGQSPSGLSATGDSDTRNYYDMVAARQKLDLRPQLERLDRLILRSEGLDPSALSFAFRPLWQLDAPAKAALALSKAQATQVYAGLGLWPAAVTARLVEAQLVQDGTYPNAQAVFAEAGAAGPAEVTSIGATDAVSAGMGSLHYLTEPRKEDGTWTAGPGGPVSVVHPKARLTLVSDPEEVKRRLEEGLAGGPSPLDDPVLPAGEDPIVNPLYGASPHRHLGTEPPLPIPMPAATTKPIIPFSGGTPKTIETQSASGLQASPSRSPLQAGKTSPPYFPEFETDPVYKYFRDRFTASSDDLMALKAQMPNDIARHMIDGFIGPGPYAQTPIELGPTGNMTVEMIEDNDIVAYGFGCHRCGSLDPGTDSGRFILDHQMPEKLKFGDWDYKFYPHCKTCARIQGGHVAIIRFRLRREGLIP